jgi:hypothetical protein
MAYLYLLTKLVDVIPSWTEGQIPAGGLERNFSGMPERGVE